MPLIPPQFLIGGAAVAIIAGFLGGWTARDWKADAEAGRAAKALLDAKDAAQKRADEAASQFEALRQTIEPARTETRNTIREVYRNVEVPADCAIRPDAAGLLEAARQRANAIAAGQPGESMPSDSADTRR